MAQAKKFFFNLDKYSTFYSKLNKKSVIQLRRRYFYTQVFREAEPRGFGGLPPIKEPIISIVQVVN
jgi:hypothetical protein